jgi:sulfate transport system ATP-binding protein
MEMADRVVVIDRGRVQQVGSPLELYEHPTNAFVMSFVGPVTPFGGTLVRPHDVEIQPVAPDPSWQPAVIERVARLGFEVRVELTLLDGQQVWSQIALVELNRLGLFPGMKVFVRAA